jgi:hypothetical protein
MTLASRALGLLLTVPWLATPGIGCSPRHDDSSTRLHPLVLSAEAGLFFGGQVSRRTDIPFELDQTRQTQGFRLHFASPLPHEARVDWELDVPGGTDTSRGAGSVSRTERSDSARVPMGAQSFEQRLTFAPTDHTGTWNLRVRFDSVVVLDRPFRLVIPTRRDRDDQ